MAIHGWGSPIWLSEIMAEFGDPGNRPVQLSQFYRGGGRVPNVAQNNAISTAGAINLGMFYGATNRAPPGSLVVWSAQYFTVPVGYNTLTVRLLGGGGGGQMGWGNYDGSGGAGAGGLAGAQWNGVIGVTSGESLYINPGAAGLGGGVSYAGPLGGDTGADGYAGQDGGRSQIIRASNWSEIIGVAGGLGGFKAWGKGNFANGQGYNPTAPVWVPETTDEFGWVIPGYWLPGSWHTGYPGQNAGVFDGNYYSGGAGGAYYGAGGGGGLGSGGGGGSSSNYSPNDFQTNGGNGGPGVIILIWS